MTEQDTQTAHLDFNGLILGFSSAALYYLGHSEVEGKKHSEINVPLALQNINIVELLKAKTVGNLSPEEAKLIDQVLIDLQKKFKEAQKS